MSEYVDKFIAVVMHNIDSDDLNNFYCNIKDLDIKNKFNIMNEFLPVMTTGQYDSRKNKIAIYKLEPAVIYHELFHMASSIWYGDCRYEGFATNDYEDYYGYVGHGLNEGYTEIMTRRYFGIEENVSVAYEYLVFFSALIEKIIGKENMERYYLNANLPALIDNLSKYISKYQAEVLVDSLDYLHLHLDKKLFLRKKKTVLALKTAKELLLISYTNKLFDLYNNKEITREELLNKIDLYKEQLISDDDELDSETIEQDLNDCMDNVLNDIDKTIAVEYKLARKKKK